MVPLAVLLKTKKKLPVFPNTTNPVIEELIKIV